MTSNDPKRGEPHEDSASSARPKPLANGDLNVGASRIYSLDESMSLPAGESLTSLTGQIQVGAEGGGLRPILMVDGLEALAEPLSDDTAAELADLMTLQHDLASVVERCGWVIAELRGSETDRAMAFWEAAVIAYGRCFGTGRSALQRAARRSLKEEDVAIGDRADHKEMKNHRDKNVGHRGPHDWLEIRVVLFSHPGTNDAIALMPLTLYQMPDESSVTRLASVATNLSFVVTERIESCRERLVSKHRIGLAELS